MKNIFKIILISTFAVLNVNALEFTDVCDKETSSLYRSGFYAGLHAGGNALEAKRFDYSYFPAIHETERFNQDKNIISGIFGGHLGYLFECNDFFFGPEIYAQYSPSHSNKVGVAEKDAFFYKLTQDLSFGGHFRFGTTINDLFMVYGLVGSKMARLTYEVKEPDANVKNKKVKYVPAFVYGFGIEKALDCHHRLRLEITRSHYNTKTFSIHQTQGTVARHSLNYSAAETAVTLGYSFMF